MPPEGEPGKKSVNKDYCFRHAQMYEGWECPLCAAEKRADAVPGHGPGGQASQGGPRAADGSGLPRPAAPASRAASRARSDEAARLLDAGSAAEALDVAEKAIESDRSNLHAYVVAVRATERTADFGRQEDLLTEAARLLRDGEYRAVSHWYHDLLRGTRDAAMARPVVAAFIAAGPWPPADSVTMIRALVTRGLAGEALRVLEGIPPERRSLAICAYGAQLTARAFAMSDTEVDAYVARIPAAERDRVLAEFRAMCEEGAFPISTLLLIRDALRTRYRSWVPEIEGLHDAAARQEAGRRLQPLTTKPGISLALKLGLATLAASIVLSALAGGWVLLIGLVLAVGAAAGGFVYGRDAELQRRLPAVLPGLLDGLAQEETVRWQLVLDDQSPVFSTAAKEEHADTAEAETEPAAAVQKANPNQ